MPIYEYVCESCGHHCEVMQKMGELSTDCPSCHKPTLKKQISAAGFQLKGSGWYATDFSGKEKKSSEKATEDKPKEATAAPSSCASGGCGCH